MSGASTTQIRSTAEQQTSYKRIDNQNVGKDYKPATNKPIPSSSLKSGVRITDQVAYQKAQERDIRASGGGEVIGSIEMTPSGKQVKTETFEGGTIVTTTSKTSGGKQTPTPQQPKKIVAVEKPTVITVEETLTKANKENEVTPYTKKEVQDIISSVPKSTNQPSKVPEYIEQKEIQRQKELVGFKENQSSISRLKPFETAEKMAVNQPTISDKYFIKYKDSQSTTGAIASTLGYTYYRVGEKTIDLGKNVIEHPIETTAFIGLSIIAPQVATGLFVAGSVATVGKSFETFIERPSFITLSEPISDVAVIGGTTVVGNYALNKVKDFYVSVGSQKVPLESVTTEGVISGKEPLPLTYSTKDAIYRFNKPSIDSTTKVVTASPSKLKGTEITVGEKIGLEDTGLYVTPKGEASLYFTRVANIKNQNSFSISQLGLFDIPTLTEIKINSVEKLPREVVEQPGFKAVEEFQKANIGEGKAYITKRSEIGQGELTPKTFTTEKEVKLGDTLIPKGTIRVEAGTTEIEAVIGVGEQIKYTPSSFVGKIKGFEQYTTFEGRNIAIREAELLTSKSPDFKSSTSEFTSQSKINKESYSFSEVGSNSFKPNILFMYGRPNTTTKSELSNLKTSSFSSVLESSNISSFESSISKPTSSELYRQSNISGTSSLESITPTYEPTSTTYSPSKITSTLNSSVPYKTTSYLTSTPKRTTPTGISTIYNPERLKTPNPISTLKDYDDERKKKQKGFKLSIRRKGEFKTVGILSEQEAHGLGTYKVGTSAAATYKIEPTGESINMSSSLKGNIRDFISKGNLYIEKRERRIKSFGEKQEITLKGIEANRKSIWR